MGIDGRANADTRIPEGKYDEYDVSPTARRKLAHVMASIPTVQEAPSEL